MMNRKEWTRLTAVGLLGTLLPTGLARPSVFSTERSKVILGAQSYSFRDRSLDATLKAMSDLGLNSCELWEGHVAPSEKFRPRNALKEWRTTVSMDYLHEIRDKFDQEGIKIQAYTVTMKDNITEEELDCIFQMTRALGTDVITSSATVSVMPRIDVYARHYNVKVAMHNHAHVDRPNEFSTPETFARGMEGNSNYIRINLDIGHFTAANCDPLDYMKKMHEKIECIHVKDRKMNNGPRTPFGEGDTPIKEVLQLIRDNQWPITANIEFEYEGDTLTEMRKCVEYSRRALME